MIRLNDFSILSVRSFRSTVYQFIHSIITDLPLTDTASCFSLILPLLFYAHKRYVSCCCYHSDFLFSFYLFFIEICFLIEQKFTCRISLIRYDLPYPKVSGSSVFAEFQPDSLYSCYDLLFCFFDSIFNTILRFRFSSLNSENHSNANFKMF